MDILVCESFQGVSEEEEEERMQLALQTPNKKKALGLFWQQQKDKRQTRLCEEKEASCGQRWLDMTWEM